jgi:hypothetical protein
MVLLVAGIIFLLNNRSPKVVNAVPIVPVSGLAYCSDEQVKPCVVSFSTDANDNMLVNILLPDRAFPNFYLKIMRSEGESRYYCRRVDTAPNSAYCAGEKLPPGEILHLTLISVRDEIILAEGDLSIIGLAYPTFEVAVLTLQETPTISTESPIQTNEPSTQTPLPLLILPTPTKTQPSYPNPSYPNPSYP